MGAEIYIPNCTKTRAMLRNVAMIQAYDQLIKTQSSRQAIKQLAMRFYLSSRQVENIVNAAQFESGSAIS